MKRLKYAHPFCGKVFPLYIILGSLLAGMLFSAFNGFEYLILYTLLPPVIVTVLFLLYFNLPDDSDRAKMQSASYPIWNTPPQELLNYIRQKEQKKQMTAVGMIIAAAVSGGVMFLLLIMPQKHRPEPILPPATAFCCALIFGGIVFFLTLYSQYRSRVWESIDETAVYTEIPIDHFFDVTHRDRYHTWTVSYIVFYLPDGRYIMKAPEGSGYAENVTIVKFRNLVSCMVLPDYY